ncbi:MAG: dicarboxylate/amino acid:cation symporter [Bacteroidetes bacterium HGW-Bacteroidetes-17]|jgi:Na+/H+-dicarboxylate symporter|nr:MAG: dicarboxylate/amino acid:cation symporter [Bacteroidetes bacterium HGW-Bacteroidetes-17]
MWKKLPIWGKIILGMVLGLIWGLIATKVGGEKFTLDWVKPFGTIFLKLLKMIAVPLIFVSLVKGISSLTDISKLSRIGMKTMIYYLVTTLIATSFGILVGHIAQPGNTFPAEKKALYQQRWENTLNAKQQLAEESKSYPLQFLEDMVPDNFFLAASDNSKMLQIIFFAILFAVAMVMVGQKSVYVSNFIGSLNSIVLKIIDIIMKFAPIGVFALLAGVIVDFSGDTDIFIALGRYFFTVVIGLLSLIFIFYSTYIKLFTRIKLKDFYKAMLPAQLVAFSTSSSAATLPVTMRQNVQELGASEKISNFVLPIGVTINMDATAFYQAVAALFIAQVYGIDLSIGQQIIIVLTATLSSIGTPAVPGGSIVMILIVMGSVGLPVEGIALVLGVDRPLDMLRTVINVTGDSTINLIISQSEGELNYPVDKTEISES